MNWLGPILVKEFIQTVLLWILFTHVQQQLAMSTARQMALAVAVGAAVGAALAAVSHWTTRPMVHSVLYQSLGRLAVWVALAATVGVVLSRNVWAGGAGVALLVCAGAVPAWRVARAGAHRWRPGPTSGPWLRAQVVTQSKLGQSP